MMAAAFRGVAAHIGVKGDEMLKKGWWFNQVRGTWGMREEEDGLEGEIKS